MARPQKSTPELMRDTLVQAGKEGEQSLGDGLGYKCRGFMGLLQGGKKMLSYPTTAGLPHTDNSTGMS